MRTILIAFALLTLYSCGSASAPAVVPGGGGSHLYDLMDEDSTAVKEDSVAATPVH